MVPYHVKNKRQHRWPAPRRLVVTFYLWFLLALTLTVASAAGVSALWSDQRWGERIAEGALTNVQLGRDLAQTLLQRPGGREELARLLRPVLEHDRASLAITGGDGEPVLLLRHPGAGPAERIVPGPEDIQRTRTTGRWLRWSGGHRFAMGLPIALPEGDGVFYVTGQGPAWRDHRPPWPFLTGMGAVLVVGWLLCWPLAAHLARPLRQLTATATRLGAGDLSARSGVERRDEIGQLAGRFNAMADNLQTLVEGHKRLLADISHELRSPLARLRVAMELAKEEADPSGPAAGYLARAERQTEFLDELIGELLDYSRLDAAPDVLHRELLSPAAWVERVAATHRPDGEARGVALVAEIAPGLPAIQADRRLLERALHNVMRNALEHAPAGTTVRITASREENRLRVAVSDEGPGVPLELRERIFEPFFRPDTARSREAGGVGLGLAIVRRCLALHGGSAHAQLGPGGRGLTLVLTLPLAAEEAEGP